MKPPLRTVLKSFLNHFEDYEARKLLSDDPYEYEFQQLKSLTDKLKEDSEYSCSCALKDVNRPKNRYKDIVPYDKSRVILPKCDGVPGSDYINASYIKGASGAFAYIAAQGPLPNTVIDFWRMIWICDVQVLVMACNEAEAGKTKCEMYWPIKGEINHYGNISVELIETSQICPDFLIRTLLVKCGSEMRDVYQFHYTTWPDHGVPDTVHPILELVRLMRDCQASETVPILVHCSAGCGRTGTICAVDFVWACLRHGKLDEDFSLFQIALELRRQRIAMIQTKEQYILAHRAVATLFEQQLNVIDCHIYVNVDEDGEPLMWKELTKNKTSYFVKESSLFKENSVPEKSIEMQSSKYRDLPQSKGSENIKPKEVVSCLDESSKENSANDFVEKEYVNRNKLCSKISISDSLINSNRNSESSFSRNSYLSQENNDDSIPFIDEEEVNIRPVCGRAYLNIPSCDSISKLVNCFDPFVDKVALEIDEGGPDVDTDIFLPNEVECSGETSKKTNHHMSNEKETQSNIGSKTPDELSQNIYATLPNSNSNKNRNQLNNRESYPPAASGYTKFECDLVCNQVNNADAKESKKVSKVGIVRRPSISKLKALFEKSGISSGKSSIEGGKRSLFRNNSHNVSRAGSAPPSLNCMDKTAAVERESILMMVTRKFRSSSVRTERDVFSKSCEKSQQKKSNAMVNFKENFSTLSRTVSFNLTKPFRSSSPIKSKAEKPSSSLNECSFSASDNATSGGNKLPKLPEIHPKGKSMWYDRTSLPRAVAVVRPVEKQNLTPIPNVPRNPKHSSEKNSAPSVINKPPKILPFFNTLNKTNEKDVSTLWYCETGDTSLCEKASDCKSTTENEIEAASDSNKNGHKVLPFIQSFAPWKRSCKSPLISPESPKKNSIENETNNQTSSSKFYAEIKEPDTMAFTFPLQKIVKEPLVNMPSCPIPEEIIPLDATPENYIGSTSIPLNAVEETKDSPSNLLISVNALDKEKPSVVKDEVIPMLNEKESVSTTKGNEVPPAIPKKMVIGKNRHFDNKMLGHASNSSGDKTSIIKFDDSLLLSEEKSPSSNILGKDLYINVNMKAQKNIEQIENTLRNNPRGAIIDLTSRESYCMEEDLDNALKQLSKKEEPKSIASKFNPKFPGYEVIWPDSNFPADNQDQKFKLKIKQTPHMESALTSNSVGKESKTGICYSPPLRRASSGLGLAKCHSCSNIDWLEPSECVSVIENSKEVSNTPTKKLVNEAVVELNTLLDQLTTRTLSEEPEHNSKIKLDSSQNKIASNSATIIKSEVSKKKPEKENLMVHSVTLVSKSNLSDNSTKEEEIIFHFPPPPPLPPPDDDQPTEIFNVTRKNGALIVTEKKSEEDTSQKPESVKQDVVNANVGQDMPQPTPRKSKQGLRRSASYTNVSVHQNNRSGYENVFLEKYQTLSRLQINPTSQSFDSKPSEVQSYRKPQPDYVNIQDLHITGSPDIKKEFSAKNSNKSSSAAIKKTMVNSKPYVSKVHKDLRSNRPENLMSESYPSSTFKMIDPQISKDTDFEHSSPYGKICKLPNKKLLIIENDQHAAEPVKTANKTLDLKKKPSPSRKTERAPLPPDVAQTLSMMGNQSSKSDSEKLALSKRLPSRKHEKAPLPPPLFKSSSSASVVKKSSPNTPYYTNFTQSKPHFAEETRVLPALLENISNTDLPNSAIPVNKAVESESKGKSHIVNRGLAHSRSDASVFLALKQNKTQSLNRDPKSMDMKVHAMNKLVNIYKEFSSVSSSDSDSSYECVFSEKPSEQSRKDSFPCNTKDQSEHEYEKSCRKQMPVAPPRSRRRNTTEIHYAKVKPIEASSHSTAANVQGQQKGNPQSPFPAIPLKTKDAFLFPTDYEKKL